MPMLMLRRARVFMLLFAALIASAATAQVERFVAGTHYTVLPEKAQFRELQSGDALPRVTEIFWYGCPHCYELDPLLNAWVQQQGDKIHFARVPAVWNAITKQHAKVFYAEQALGVYQKMHTPIFDTIHQERNFLTDEKSVAALFARHGVEQQQFAAAFNSFSMDSTLRKTEAMVLALQLPAVPALVVDGQYLVSGTDKLRSYETMLEVVEFLLQK